MTHDLTKKAGRGIAWNLVNQLTQQIVNFFVIVILARLLAPADFGIFGMAVIFTNFFQPFKQWGFQAFLIQKKDLDREYEYTAFWSMYIVGFSLFIISVICAPFIGIYFNTPQVGQLVAVIAIGFLFSPLGAIQWALVNRELKFKKITVRDTIVNLLYGAIVCLLAFKGLGVWALVIATLARELAMSVVFWFVHDWRPQFKFNVIKLKEMIGFSTNCIGSGMVNYAINNIDNLFVGKYLGAANLGFYNLAFNTVSYPQSKLVANISSVAFPAFSLIQDDRERLRDAYLKTVRSIMLVITPLISILFISAKEFVLVLYGEKWLFAVIPIQIMCLYGLIRGVSCISGAIFLSKGRADLDFKISVLKLILFAVFLFLGLRHGIIGVSIAVLLYSVVTFFPTFYFTDKLLDLRNLTFCFVVLRYIILSLVVISGVWAVNNIFLRHCAILPFFHLCLNIMAGLLLYFIAVIIFCIRDLKDLIGLIKKVLSRE